jgi:hypothetical protein
MYSLLSDHSEQKKITDMSQIGTSDIFSDLHVDSESKSLLQTTTKWAKITAIIGLISAALTLVTTLTGIAKAENQLVGMMMSGSMFFIIPVVIVMIILNIFLLRFAASTAGSLDNMDQGTFNQGINFLKMYFKTLGIIIIVIIGFVLIVLIAYMIGSAVG